MNDRTYSADILSMIFTLPCLFLSACGSSKEGSSTEIVVEDSAAQLIEEAPLELGPQQLCSDPSTVGHVDRAEELGVRRRSGRLDPFLSYGGAGLIDWNQDGHLDLIYGYPGEDLILYLQRGEEVEQQILPLKGGALQWGEPWGSSVLMVANAWITLYFPEEEETPYEILISMQVYRVRSKRGTTKIAYF
jgi:hypothetical protein